MFIEQPMISKGSRDTEDGSSDAASHELIAYYLLK